MNRKSQILIIQMKLIIYCGLVLLLVHFSIGEKYQKSCYNKDNYIDYKDAKYAHQDFFDFFTQQVKKYSDGKLSLSHSQEKGFQIIAESEIRAGEFFLFLPVKYILQVFSNFQYKGYIINAIKNLNRNKGQKNDIPQTLVLALRILIGWKQYGTIPWCEMGNHKKDGTVEDMWFMNKMMSYYSQLKLDDFHSWTYPQVQYYKQHGLPYELQTSREYYYNGLMKELKLMGNATELIDLISNFTEVNHWWSVVTTRNHGGMSIQWKLMWNLTDSRYQRDLDDNDIWEIDNVNFVIPLLDIMNHYAPKSMEDDYSFKLNIFPPHPQYSKCNSIAVSTLIPLLIPGDEVTYVYNQQMESFKYLQSYGFTVENNPFSAALLRAQNYFKMLSANEIDVCRIVGCLDIEMEIEDFYNTYRNHSKMQFQLTKLTTPNLNLLNIFRVKFLSEEGLVDLTNQQAKLLMANNLRQNHYWGYQNELLSIMKYINVAQSFYSKGIPIQKDKNIIQQLMQQYGSDAWVNDDIRRKILTHQVTIEKKQAKQFHILYALERGIDIIFRNVKFDLIV
ncbi:hypothetical protein FGO68_gene10585 [Halteria grandinella]|uniref:SET domain-containing protein n=1 Tax=Halteria grandinella TaxID=5974 RepID=A0A8J8T2R1_HALGN|nr:hypothetical protein FGO68_gene10585 [Halteria grandinella]